MRLYPAVEARLRADWNNSREKYQAEVQEYVRTAVVPLVADVINNAVEKGWYSVDFDPDTFPIPELCDYAGANCIEEYDPEIVRAIVDDILRNAGYKVTRPTSKSVVISWVREESKQ